MPVIILGDDKCKCLTSFEKYWILGALQESIKKTEGDIRRTQERRKIDILTQVKIDL